MTGYAIDLERHRVLIASDTAIHTPNPLQLVGFTSKVHPLPHLRAVMLGRGNLHITRRTFWLLTMLPGIDTVEQLVDAMQDTVCAASRWFCKEFDDPAAAEIYVVGWSAHERRMCMWLWTSLDAFQLRRAPGALYGRVFAIPPLPVAEMPAAAGSVKAQLVSVMKVLHTHYQAHPEGGIGGEVELWSLSPNGLSQRVAHRFPD